MVYNRQALKVMSHAYNSKTTTYPLDHLQKVLCTDVNELNALCHAMGIQIVNGAVIFQKSSFIDTEVGLLD